MATVLILERALAGFPQNMTEGRTDLNTMRPLARANKGPGALFSDRCGMKKKTKTKQNKNDAIDTDRAGGESRKP